ncbi:hypothetical protein MMC18_008028 [Xylographa bjoerkii]|nr:hypothetical protein [Xylographa bjoerkii]
MAESNKRKRFAGDGDTYTPTSTQHSDFHVKQRPIQGEPNGRAVPIIQINAFIVARSSKRKISKPGAPGPFPFFRLPREIRDEILAYCLLPPDTKITGGACPHPPHLGWYDDICAPLDLYCPGRPTFALLTVSKQMHEEAAFNLYTRSRFHFLIATTHCANLVNARSIENNTVQIAPRYLRMMKCIVLDVAIEAFCCHLPRYEYIRVKKAVQKFAEDLGGPGRELARLFIRYSEFESEHTRATHVDARQRPDHEWTRSQVMNHLRVEYNSNHDLGYLTMARGPRTAKHQYQNALEPLGTVFDVEKVLTYGVDDELGVKLKRAMQSRERLCEPKSKVDHVETGKTKGRRRSRAIKWWDSTFEWEEDQLRPTTSIAGKS